MFMGWDNPYEGRGGGRPDLSPSAEAVLWLDANCEEKRWEWAGRYSQNPKKEEKPELWTRVQWKFEGVWSNFQYPGCLFPDETTEVSVQYIQSNLADKKRVRIESAKRYEDQKIAQSQIEILKKQGKPIPKNLKQLAK
jgi:hypothetical protein